MTQSTRPAPIAKFPYMLHTNRELGLMLRGIKPLALFNDAKDRFPDVVVRYLRMFDRHVGVGTFIRADHFAEPTHDRAFAVHTILFAQPDESWRISAMIKLRTSPIWSLAHERREGELLGYADWMNDFWIARCRG